MKSKTAWNADSLRGDYADKLIFDEWQLVNEDAWGLVGAPMLLDTDGDAVFIYTPPSLRSRSVSKANDPQHAAKLFKKAQELQNGGSTRWAVFHFTSMDNPYLSRDALGEISQDMTDLAYRMEILAEDVNEAPGALWTRKSIEDNRVQVCPECQKIVVALDPSTTSEGDEAGIIVTGKAGNHGYVIDDNTIQGSPLVWAKAAVEAYRKHSANLIVAEKNQGGEMVELTIHQVDPDVPVKLVHASRGKQVRAEPISAKAEKGQIHHVGSFPALEDELCLWIPGEGDSPNRLDAMVWGMVELILPSFFGDSVFQDYPA
ncbi:MAG: DNA-packaging protein [Deltaproteobacteria bacterium]|nr:DNA-packaging protein [Deltaproteobacteria bacterium]